MSFFRHLFRHHHPFYYKDHSSSNTHGLFRAVGCSVVLWLLAAVFVVLLVTMYYLDVFTVQPIMMIGQSGRPEGSSLQKEEYCDLTDGTWVRNIELPPPYSNVSCPTMPDSKNCGKYGKDMDYLNWRWKPRRCELPAFNAKRFLEMVRGKSLGFVGDSVARNQYESLLCLLSQESTPVDVYRDADDRFRTWSFPSHNFTLRAIWSRFLLPATERLHPNGSSTGVFDLLADSAEPSWSDHLRDLDLLVLSTGHWFFRKLYLRNATNLIGCVFCSEPNTPSIPVSSTIATAIRAALRRVEGCLDCREGLLMVVRTFSPAHFENGAWDGGGVCNRTAPAWEGELDDGTAVEIGSLQAAEVKKKKGKVEVAEVTRMMAARGDGHPGLHWNNVWMKGYRDCVHWCMPGPVDAWNQILLELVSRSRRTTTRS